MTETTVTMILIAALILSALTLGFGIGRGTAHDCKQVGETIRTDRHVYRVCR